MELNAFRGTGVALVTPFGDDGSIDFPKFSRHVEAQIEGGVEFLVPCGTTGESATMTAEERESVIAAAVEAAGGRVPVMGGAGTNDTREAVAMSRAAARAGADAILSVSPYYNKPTQNGLYAHFEAIASSVDLPVFVYNVPGRTSSNVQAETMLRLTAIENIAGVKEASGDLDQVATIVSGRPSDFLVLSGDDALSLPIIALGGDGVISVVSNEAPDPMSNLVRAALAGELARARDLHYLLLPLMTANFIETNPIPVKTALEMMDRMPANFRLPLVPMDEGNRGILRSALELAGLL